MVSIGIDPGISGGIAAIGENGLVVIAKKMPETERDVCDFLSNFDSHSFAFIESVHAMPKQGVSSTFKFGRNYGFLRGVLIALQIPFQEVSPAVWQRKMECLSHGDKNITKARAQQLFPNVTVTHAVADALLIAEHGRREYLSRETWGDI